MADIAWSPTDKDSDITLSNGNRTATRGSAGFSYRGVIADTGISSGKAYLEFILGIDIYFQAIGIIKGAFFTQLVYGWGYTTLAWTWRYAQGDFHIQDKYHNNISEAYGPDVVAGDIVGLAIDMDNGKIWISINGAWQGDPAAGTNPMYSGITGTVTPCFNAYFEGSQVTICTSIATCSYSPPTGFAYYTPTVYSISGIIQNAGSFGSRTVAICKRSDGTPVYVGPCSAVDGSFYQEVNDDTYYVIALDDVGGKAPKILGKISPIVG